MWDMIRGLASRIAELLGISVPEVPDVTATVEQVGGAAESAVADTQAASQTAAEQLGGIAQSAGDAVTGATSAAADMTATVTEATSTVTDATATAAESAAAVTETVQPK